MTGFVKAIRDALAGPIRWGQDLLYRYDFFVSYRWSDGRGYALALRDQLEGEGFVVFLDSSDYAKGDHWTKEGRRALKRTSRLLVVGSPGALQSDAVLQEVRIFANLGRRIMPIDFDGTLDPGKPRERLLEYIEPEVIRIAETGDALLTGPSRSVIEDIAASFAIIRENRRRFLWARRIIAALLVLTMAAVWFALDALRQRDQAQEQLARGHFRPNRHRAGPDFGRARLDPRAAGRARSRAVQIPTDLYGERGSCAPVRGQRSGHPHRTLGRKR